MTTYIYTAETRELEVDHWITTEQLSEAEMRALEDQMSSQMCLNVRIEERAIVS